MGAFQTRTIEEVTETLIDYRGKTPPKAESGVRLITAKVIKDGFIQEEKSEYISEETYAYWMRRGYPQQFDIVLTTEAPLGEAAQLRTSERIALAQRVILLRGNPSIIDQQFFFQAVKSPIVQAGLQRRATGTTVLGIKQSELRQVSIPCPPLPTQRRIAAILSAYDDLIENNLRRIALLEQMAQGLYREWFVKFRFPGWEGVRFVDSALGRVPEGWGVNTIENTFAILGGGTPSKVIPEYWTEGTINWYSPTDLTATNSMFMEQSRHQISELGLKHSSARLFPAFSVMMTSRATLGVISINTTEACTNQGFITCVPNNRFPLYTLYYWLKENVEYFITLGTGATFKEITKGVFKTIELVVPAPAVVAQFEDTVQQFALQVLNLQRKTALLRRTRDLLLPRLISGAVDVSALEIAMPEAGV